MMRVILVPLDGSAHDRVALAAAGGIAHGLKAHVEALFVRAEPLESLTVAGEGMSPDMLSSIARSAADTAAHQHGAARDAFEHLLRTGLELVDAPVPPERPTARWREVVGRHDAHLVERGRLADLIVLSGVGDRGEPQRRAMFESALLNTGRPLLLIPASLPEQPGTEIAVAWNASPESVRAVMCALPLLARASRVHVLTVVTAKTQASAGEHLAEYLAWHGIGCERHVLHPYDGEVGAAILGKAAEIPVGLLVLGGYGHSRMRELIFGGVTRHVLGAFSLPVLLAH